MKKYLLLGLILMLLAPSPLSARKLILVLYENCIDLETLKENIYFDGGTYRGTGSFVDPDYPYNWEDIATSSTFEYEFDDNQTTTRFHATLPQYRLKIADSKSTDMHSWKDCIFIDSGEVPISTFVSDEFNLGTNEDLFLFLGSTEFKSITASVFGENLSAQLRHNEIYIEGQEAKESSDLIPVEYESFSVLDEKQAPFENYTITKDGLNSFCINGFDWKDSRKSLHVMVNGETIEDIRTIQEYHKSFHPVRYEVIYPKGDGVDIRLEESGTTTIFAELIDIPETFDVLPYTYRNAAERTLSIKGVDKSLTGDVILPSEETAYYLSGWKVTGIDEFAMLNNTNITSLMIPSSIESIGNNALSGMKALSQINVASDNKIYSSSDGVLYTKAGYTLLQFPIGKATQYEVPMGTRSIGRDAFYQSNLTSITLPTSLLQIGYDAFGYSTKLKEVNIPSKVATIDEYAFDHCTSLTSVTLPKLTELPNYAFNNCSALVSIDLPSSLTKIGESAFNRCTKLKSIILPSITELSKNAFNYCTSLTYVVLPASLLTVGEKAFNNCTALTTITCWMENPIVLPDNAYPEVIYNNATLNVPVGSVEKYKAASGWKKFKNIVGVVDFADAKVKAICIEKWDTNGDSELDKNEAAAVTSLGSTFTGNTTITTFNELKYFTGLTKIDENAFKGCKALKSIIVPANVKQIGKSAFYGDYALTDIVLPEGLEVINDYAIGACTKLTEIELPSTLTTIKTRAFYYDKLLAKINIPTSVTSIGTYAFASCPVLLDVTANMMAPCTIAENVFPENTYSKGTLTVPYGTYDKYKTTNYWSKFVNIKSLAGQVSISAAPISIVAGESGDLVLRLEQNLPSVSFQFDLTLAYGITLQNATVIPSSDFAVSTAKVGTNKWRILAYSPTNKPLSANVGDLMTLNIQTEELLSAGTRTVTISDFTLTNLGANNYLSYISLDGITSSVTVTAAPVTNAGKGDVNLDGTVNVQDIVVLINHIFGSTPAKFSTANADANGDGIVNVVDVSTIVLLCMPATSSNPAPAHAPAASLASMTWDTTNGLALSIDDATSYVAAQMDVTVDGTLQVNNITAVNGHTPVWQQIGENRYRVLVFSSANDTFSAFGPHLFFDVLGEGEITLSNALLVDAAGEGFNAAASSTGITTGISTITTELSAPADVYSVSGQLVRHQASSLKGLPTGTYIVNGRKLMVK